MEIEKKSTRVVEFSTLGTGDVFILEEDDGAVYMVVDKDFGLGEDRDYDGYAIDLKNGWHYGFDNKDDVIKVVAKLTITD